MKGQQVLDLKTILLSQDANPNADNHDTSSQAVKDFRESSDYFINQKSSQSGNITDNNASSRVDQFSASLASAKNSYDQYTTSTRQAEWITADPDHVPTIPGITRPSCSTPTAITSKLSQTGRTQANHEKSAAESQKVCRVTLRSQRYLR